MIKRPITVTLAALGGQGGGVVMNWLIDVAEGTGWQVQATSVPGVAQRTGATIYYMELAPPAEPLNSASVSTTNQPWVMALMPSSGASDLIVAAELAEAVRMVERGIVDRTSVLITSTHRAYTIDEKSAPGDGRASSAELLASAQHAAERMIAFNMDRIARQHGSVISAVLLGAIAGSGVLPFPAERYEAAIRRGNKGVDPSLAAFAAGLAATLNPPDDVSPAAEPTVDPRLLSYPTPVRQVLEHALPRLTDYQDARYAEDYLGKVRGFIPVDAGLAAEVAKGLALWMTFEDTIRIAQVKTRPARLQSLIDASSGPDRLVHITEFLKPRPEEIFGTLPRALGEMASRSPRFHRLLTAFTQGRHVRTTGLRGYLLFRCISGLRFMRRSTLRFHHERAGWEAWLDCVRVLSETNLPLAREVASCQQLVAGYGETHARGRGRFDLLLQLARQWAIEPTAAQRIAALREAALEDDSGTALNRLLATYTTGREAA